MGDRSGGSFSLAAGEDSCCCWSGGNLPPSDRTVQPTRNGLGVGLSFPGSLTPFWLRFPLFIFTHANTYGGPCRLQIQSINIEAMNTNGEIRRKTIWANKRNNVLINRPVQEWNQTALQGNKFKHMEVQARRYMPRKLAVTAKNRSTGTLEVTSQFMI